MFKSIALISLCWLALTGSSMAQDMRFRWVPIGSAATCGTSCPKVIEARGTITAATPRAFQDFVASAGTVPGARPVVVLHSPGGLLAGGIRLGLMFRRLGMSVFVGRFAGLDMLVEAGVLDGGTAAQMARVGRGGDRAVTGTCVSACVYAFLGGRQRFVPERSRIGVHKPFRAEDRYDTSPTRDLSAVQIWDRQEVIGMQRAFIEAMGVDPELIRVELGTPSNRIRYLTAAELRRLRMVTAQR